MISIIGFSICHVPKNLHLINDVFVTRYFRSEVNRFSSPFFFFPGHYLAHVLTTPIVNYLSPLLDDWLGFQLVDTERSRLGIEVHARHGGQRQVGHGELHLDLRDLDLAIAAAVTAAASATRVIAGSTAGKVYAARLWNSTAAAAAATLQLLRGFTGTTPVV